MSLSVLIRFIKYCVVHSRLCLLVFTVLCLQYALWFGWGNWLQVWSLRKEIEQQKAMIIEKEHRNISLLTNVRSMESTNELLEEKAREELGLIEASQVYYDVYFKRPLSTTRDNQEKNAENHFL